MRENLAGFRKVFALLRCLGRWVSETVGVLSLLMLMVLIFTMLFIKIDSKPDRGGSGIFSYEDARMINVPSNNVYVIGDVFHTIGKKAFWNTDVAFLDLNKVKRVSDKGIGSSQPHLKKVIAPYLESVGRYSFQGQKFLSSFQAENLKYIDDSAFAECENLKEISMRNVITIGSWSFCNCKSLVRIQLPKVEKINRRAFLNCVHLQHIDFNKDVNIEDSAFLGCPALDEPTRAFIQSKNPKAFVYIYED